MVNHVPTAELCLSAVIRRSDGGLPQGTAPAEEVLRFISLFFPAPV